MDEQLKQEVSDFGRAKVSTRRWVFVAVAVTFLVIGAIFARSCGA